jgi:hypothetical protein
MDEHFNPNLITARFAYKKSAQLNSLFLKRNLVSIQKIYVSYRFLFFVKLQNPAHFYGRKKIVIVSITM